MDEILNYVHELLVLAMQYRWLTTILVLGLLSFAFYRVVDLWQTRFVAQYKQPDDLKLSAKVYLDKRERKRARSMQLFWKGSVSWLVQAIYVCLVPFAIVVFHGWKLSYGWIYAILIVTGFLMNMLISKLFPLWTPTRPFICRGYQHEHVWNKGNLAFHAWGVASWTIPVYFLWDAFAQNGWIGSVVFIVISQLLQVFVFIYVIKRAAIPYQQYPDLSAQFKENLHHYLQSQGLRDDQVGVLAETEMGPNAFATGILGYKQIVLTDELIKGYPDPTNPQFTLKLSDDTLEAITAHEAGHLHHHHITKGLFWGILLQAVVTIAVYHLFSGDPRQYLLFHENTTHQLLLYWGQSIFNVMLVYPITFMMLYLSRRKEWEADTFLLTTNGCKNGADFFYQMRHLAPIANADIWHACNGTHPAPEEREQRMRKWAAEHCKK
jgi:Zn-dependent protease with chaperone function